MKFANSRVLFAAGLLAFGSLLFAKDPVNAKDEQARLHNSGEVMHEILNVPDDIPQGLLDKARCVVVMPSVLKAAFVVGEATVAAQWSAAPAGTSAVPGALPPCTHWKALALASRSVVKPRTSYS